MLRDKQRKISIFLLHLLLSMLTIVHLPLHADLSTIAKNDPFPMFTTLSIDDALLLTRKQLFYKFDELDGREYEWADKKRDHVLISVSPFAQNADRGKTIKGSICPQLTLPPALPPCPVPVSCTTTPPCPEIQDVALGDLTGRTDMIALLYGPRPVDFEQRYPVLFEASEALFPDDEGLDNEANIDPAQRLGFFSFPLKYRKRGLRVEVAGRLCSFLFQIQAGFATIRQVREATINLTNLSTETPAFTPEQPKLTPANVNEFLMNQLDAITDEINVDFCDFIETSLEDFRFNLFWRDAFPVNEDAESSWARFLAIPYFELSGSFSPVKINNNRQFFSVPFGNNGHSSAGLTAGINFDFLETIEIGGEVGFTHFFRKEYCNMPIPTSEYQQNLYPFSTKVSIKPGESWYFCAHLAAYHFLDHLSMHFEWYVLDHQKDHIKILEENPGNLFVDDEDVPFECGVFLPEVLECRSTFKVKFGNIALNYDLSPNFNLGLLWQIPFSQRNAYRSSTIMAGLNVTF